MVQYSQINKRNIPHKQKQRQKPLDHINRCGKSIYKVQHPFMKKTLSKLGIEGAFLNIIKAIYERRTDNIILNGQTLRALSLRSGTRQCQSEFYLSPKQSVDSMQFLSNNISQNTSK